MLRSLVLILLVVNATFLAWSQGWLKPIVGVQPDAQHEPARLQQQLHADRIAVLNEARPASAAAPSSAADAASAASTAATPSSAPSPSPSAAAASTSSAVGSAALSAAPNAPSAAMASTLPNAPSNAEAAGICLQAGPFRPEDMAQVSATLKALLPNGGWAAQPALTPGVWLVYMGPYPDTEFYARKLSELRRIKGLNFEEVNSPPALAQGLSLGRYTSLPEAQAGLAAMKLRGIRTARVVVLRPPAELQLVRVAQAPMRTQVALSGAKLPQGKAFSACRP